MTTQLMPVAILAQAVLGFLRTPVLEASPLLATPVSEIVTSVFALATTPVSEISILPLLLLPCWRLPPSGLLPCWRTLNSRVGGELSCAFNQPF